MASDGTLPLSVDGPARRRGVRRVATAALTAALVSASAAVVLPAPAAFAEDPPPTTAITVMVQKVATSAFTPPLPDPSGIAWMSDSQRFMVSDSEVEEMPPYFAGVNLYETDRTGAQLARGVTQPWSNEPTGLAYRASDRTLFVSDDNLDSITSVAPGPDGRHGTADDVLLQLPTSPLNVDAEDVAYDSSTGDLFVIDGINTEVWRTSPGPDGMFAGGDEVWTNFDVAVYGARDPEGIAYWPARDSLLIVDDAAHTMFELSKTGALVQKFTINIVTGGPAGASQVADVEVAPGSMRPDRDAFWLVDRGVDNNIDPLENDGKIYELPVPDPTNTPPTQPSVSATPAVPKTNDVMVASITVPSTDVDGDPIVYRYQWRKNGVAIPGETGTTLDLSKPGNGDKGDAIAVRVVAFDGIAESLPRTSTSRTIVDSPATFNQDLGDRTNAEGQVISLSAGATDADLDPLAYSATDLPPGLGIDPATGLISGTIDAGASATSPYSTAITVSENGTAVATDSFTWSVVVDTAPVVDSVVIDPAAPGTNDTLTATATAHDDDNDPLTYAYQWAKNGIDIPGATGSTLDLSAAGNGDKGDTITVTATVTDVYDVSANGTSTVVTVGNTAPAFDQDLGDRTDTEGTVVSLAATATDPDLDPLTYGATGLPPGLTVDPATGTISGTIAFGSGRALPYSVSVSVSDAVSTVSDTFAWTVPDERPAAPTGLTTTVTTTGVDLAWTANTELDLAGYGVYRSAAPGGPFTKLHGGLLLAPSYTDSTAPLGTSYYRVTAVDTTTHESVPAETSATRRIAFRSLSTRSARDVTSVSIARPAGTASGDLLVAAITFRGTPTVSAPAGWTFVRSATNGTAMRQAVFTKVATSSEPTGYTFGFSLRTSVASTILNYRGASAVTPVDASSGQVNASSVSITAPGLTTTVGDTLLVGVFGIVGNPGVTPPATMAERTEVRQTSGQTKVTIEVSDAILPAAGATGTRTATASAAGLNIGFLLAIRPS